MDGVQYRRPFLILSCTTKVLYSSNWRVYAEKKNNAIYIDLENIPSALDLKPLFEELTLKHNDSLKKRISLLSRWLVEILLP